MRASRLLAALFVLISGASLPILLESPVYAVDSSYSYADYVVQLNDANAAVSAAQDALTNAQAAYNSSSIPVVTSSGSGLTVKIYNNTISRTPNESSLCRTDVVSQIAANWGSGSVMGCNSDRVTIHYYGTITVPDTGAYRFLNIADDGWYMTINGQVVNSDWRDKGCNGSWSAPTQMTAGTAYILDAWYYENGGGACSTLYTTQPNGNYQVVPSSWFGTTSVTSYQKDPELLTVVAQKAAELQTAKDALAAVPSLYISAPSDFMATVNGSMVSMAWLAPTSGVLPERYAVSWTDGVGGWGVASTSTSFSIDAAIVASTAGWDKSYTFTIRSDQDTAHMYSSYSNAVTIYLANPTPPVVVVIPPAPVETPTSTVDSQTVQNPPQDTSTATTQETTTPITSPETSTGTSSNPISPNPVETPPVPNPTPVSLPEPPAPPAPRPQPSPQPIPDPIPDPVPVPDPQPAPDPVPDPAPDVPDVPAVPPDEPMPVPEPQQDPGPVPAPDPAPVPAPEPAPAPEPIPAPEPPVIVTADTTAETWVPAVAPEEYLAPEEIKAYEEIGLVPNSADQLPDDVPKVAPAEVLVEHIQVDVAGVENGGIQFFGTKTAPQVVNEDGTLTPPAPPPGSGLPIPPEAITVAATFIGQPGGTTFNAPDVAIPVVLTPVALPDALNAVPGVGAAAEAVNQAYVAMANIGNDMSPVTRKKAKKILIATVVAGQIIQIRRRF